MARALIVRLQAFSVQMALVLCLIGLVSNYKPLFCMVRSVHQLMHQQVRFKITIPAYWQMMIVCNRTKMMQQLSLASWITTWRLLATIWRMTHLTTSLRTHLALIGAMKDTSTWRLSMAMERAASNSGLCTLMYFWQTRRLCTYSSWQSCFSLLLSWHLTWWSFCTNVRNKLTFCILGKRL